MNKTRKILATLTMVTNQIAEAQRMAREWMAEHPQ